MEAWIGLAGIVVGGALGWTAKWWQTKREWEREDRTRWHGTRRELYVQYTEAVDRVAEVVRTKVASDTSPPEGYVNPSEMQIQTWLNSATFEVDRLNRQIALVASQPAVDAAEAVWVQIAPCGPRGHMQDQELPAINAALGEFREAVRAELGVNA